MAKGAGKKLEKIRLEELEKVENKWMTMREYLPPSQHRHWKESYLNKTVLQVRIEIKKHLRRNKK